MRDIAPAGWTICLLANCECVTEKVSGTPSVVYPGACKGRYILVSQHIITMNQL